jgi:hypothetical protein
MGRMGIIGNVVVISMMEVEEGKGTEVCLISDPQNLRNDGMMD